MVEYIVFKDMKSFEDAVLKVLEKKEMDEKKTKGQRILDDLWEVTYPGPRGQRKSDGDTIAYSGITWQRVWNDDRTELIWKALHD